MGEEIGGALSKLTNLCLASQIKLHVIVSILYHDVYKLAFQSFINILPLT